MLESRASGAFDVRMLLPSKCEIDENLLVINDWNKSNTGDEANILSMISVGIRQQRRRRRRL